MNRVRGSLGATTSGSSLLLKRPSQELTQEERHRRRNLVNKEGRSVVLLSVEESRIVDVPVTADHDREHTPWARKPLEGDLATRLNVDLWIRNGRGQRPQKGSRLVVGSCVHRKRAVAVPVWLARFHARLEQRPVAPPECEARAA